MADTRFMLDTNIASYVVRGPGAALAARLVAVPMAQLCVSSITQAELLHGLFHKNADSHGARRIGRFHAPA